MRPTVLHGSRIEPNEIVLQTDRPSESLKSVEDKVDATAAWAARIEEDVFGGLYRGIVLDEGDVGVAGTGVRVVEGDLLIA
jgi:hypothetical protein